MNKQNILITAITIARVIPLDLINHIHLPENQVKITPVTINRDNTKKNH
jgi:hypothetical protein